jgi:molecular chaperone GrpE
MSDHQGDREPDRAARDRSGTANGRNQSEHPRRAGGGGGPGNAGGELASPEGELASAQGKQASAQGEQATAEQATTGAQLAELRSRVSAAEDLRLRALADLDNLRKRCAAQVERAAAEARAAVAAEWLPVVDNLDLALEHSQADPDAIIQGVRSVRDQALRVLAGLGYPRRDDVGAAFDPARHDAIAVHNDPGAAAGTVIDVVRPGYGDAEHQLRPAQVVVAKAE